MTFSSKPCEIHDIQLKAELNMNHDCRCLSSARRIEIKLNQSGKREKIKIYLVTLARAQEKMDSRFEFLLRVHNSTGIEISANKK